MLSVSGGGGIKIDGFWLPGRLTILSLTRAGMLSIFLKKVLTFVYNKMAFLVSSQLP